MVFSFARDIFRPLGDVVAGDTELWADAKGRRLSDRVWLSGDLTRRQIDKRLRLAIARGDDPIHVARELEQYLDPRLAPVRDARTGRLLRSKRDGHGSILRDDQGRPIPAQPRGAITRTPRGGSGSYAARRLARTEISRDFAQSALDAAALNPFVEGMKWNLSGSHKDADACDGNARGNSRGMDAGEYRLNEFPQMPNHPQCRCFATSVTPDDVSGVVAQLRRDFDLDLQPANVVEIRRPSRARELVTNLFRAARQLIGREAA